MIVDLDTRSRDDTAHLLVSCPDRPGIIAAVSTLLHGHGINIIQSDQYSTDPEGGSFYLRMVLHVPDVASRLGELRRELRTEVADPFAMHLSPRDAAASST